MTFYSERITKLSAIVFELICNRLYVKKNKKDDISTGIMFVAGAVFLGFIGNLIVLLQLVFYGAMPYLAGGGATYADVLSELGLNPTTLIITKFISLIAGILFSPIGIAITHYIVSALGGKAKMGEYFYMGGKFMFLVALIILVFDILNVVPCINCIVGLVMLLFKFYAFYLFIMLIEALYTVSKLKAFVGIVIGYITASVLLFAVLSMIGAVTGLPIGWNIYERIIDYYQNLGLNASA